MLPNDGQNSQMPKSRAQSGWKKGALGQLPGYHLPILPLLIELSLLCYQLRSEADAGVNLVPRGLNLVLSRYSTIVDSE